MKYMIATLSLVITALVFAAPIKNNLGASATINTEQTTPFENPYVTDGLVAMFDGEWNAGWGIHDETATEWKDLCGGESLIIGGGTPIINAQSIDCSSQGKGICYWKYSSGREIAFASPTSYSIEVVCKVNINVDHVVFRNGDNRFWQGLKNRIILGALRNITPSLRALPTIVSYYLDFVNRATYRNGELYTKTGLDSNTFRSGRFIIGTDNSSYAGAEVFAFRVYSRALTAEEIAANYAIDKERFNLP